MHKTFPLPVIEFPLAEEVPTASEESFHCHKKREATAVKIALLLKSRRNCQSKTVTLIPASSETTDTTSDGTGKKKGRTITLTTEDMQKRKNDVKKRTTLLLSLPDEHQLRFSKHKTAQELWAAILKTFGGNEATKKTKKNLLKQQYGNFKAKGAETIEQKFNRLHVIVSQLQFIDVEIEQDDLNQKFLTSLAPEWLMHTIVWRNKSDLDTMSLDDLYNHLKVYESEVQKKSEPNSQNMAFISSTKHSRGNEDVNTASVSTASTNVPTASAIVGVASISQDTACAYIAFQSSGSQIKFEDINQIDEDDIEEMDIKWNIDLLSMRADKAPRSQDRGRRDNYRQGSNVEERAPKALMAIDGKLELIKKEKKSLDGKLAGFQTASKDLDSLLKSQRLEKNKEGLGYSVAPPPPTQIYSSSKKDMYWTGLLEFKDDTVTDYSRPAPTVESSPNDTQNRNPSVTETKASISIISPKSLIKFVKANDSPTKSKIEKAEKAKKSLVKKFSTVNRKFPTANRKFPTGGTKFHTADIGKKGKAQPLDHTLLLGVGFLPLPSKQSIIVSEDKQHPSSLA
nr:hypothetical protein [Tanacetum cinerariifolium]